MNTPKRPPKIDLGRLGRNDLARGVLWMLLGNSGRLFTNVLYYLILINTLDPAGMGAFVAASALVAMAAPFSDAGAGTVMIKEVASDASRFPVSWGLVLTTVPAFSALLTTGVLLARPYALPAEVGWGLLLRVSLADMTCNRLVECCSQAALAMHEPRRSAAILFRSNALRVVAAVLLAGYVRLSKTPGSDAAAVWGWLYLGSSALAAASSALGISRRYGLPVAGARPWASWALGLSFSLSIASRSFYTNVDKVVLSRLAGLDTVGMYGVVSRIVDIAFLPLASLNTAMYAKMFQHGANGINASVRFAAKALPFALAYGCASGLGLAVLAPLFPYVLGYDDPNIIAAVRWFAPLALLRLPSYIGADVLTGSGHQTSRVLIQVGAAALCLHLCYALASAYSWKGAIWSVLICETAHGLAMTAAVVYYSRKEKTDRLPA